MNRRSFLLAASAAAGGAAAASAPAGAQENASSTTSTGTPGGNATGGNASGNATGGNASASGNATGGNASGNQTGGGGGGGPTKQVAVGPGSANVFEPAEVQIPPGGTVVWEWVDSSGSHNVVAEGGAFDSGEPISEAGATFEHTFQEAGEFSYICEPHVSVGMEGVVTVAEGGGGGGGGGEEVDPEEMGVPFQAHFVGIATLLMMTVTFVYTFFVLKYGESPRAKGGD
jgi:halocyanin-like protein